MKKTNWRGKKKTWSRTRGHYPAPANGKKEPGMYFRHGSPRKRRINPQTLPIKSVWRDERVPGPRTWRDSVAIAEGWKLRKRKETEGSDVLLFIICWYYSSLLFWLLSLLLSFIIIYLLVSPIPPAVGSPRTKGGQLPIIRPNRRGQKARGTSRAGEVQEEGGVW